MSEGYLVCENCKGYYQLQKGEKASDFDICECGGRLIFKKDLVSSDQHIIEETEHTKDSPENFKEKSEEKTISKSSKNRAEKRKELFGELTKEVHVHEELLDIKDGKISSNEVTGNLRDSDNQMMVSNILTNESRINNNSESSSNIKADENKLINQIHDKRSSVRESDNTGISGFNIKIIIVLVVILGLAGAVLLLM